MESYLNNSKKAYFTENPVLSSLVVNVPYSVDSYTTAPKISKLLTFPFGIRIDAASLFRLTYQGIILSTLFMTIASLSILCFYLPLQKQNEELFTTAKSLTNKKFSLLVKVQEASSYNKLFSNANTFSLKDTQETIYLNKTNQNTGTETPKSLISFNKYPSIQFSGY